MTGSPQQAIAAALASAGESMVRAEQHGLSGTAGEIVWTVSPEGAVVLDLVRASTAPDRPLGDLVARVAVNYVGELRITHYYHSSLQPIRLADFVALARCCAAILEARSC